MIDLIRVSDEVATALAEDDAVVALETTLVAHGFPAPDGVEVGLASEAAVRAAGATPATIGVLDGRIHIGLAPSELEQFTPAARKLGPRDLAVCAVQGAIGATTVGGTLAAGAAVGIRFMGTGGLGGVHRGFPTPPDISADLAAAARIPAVIASSGVKSLLDVPATVELLETLSVPVLGYRTDTLPLFYAAEGGPPVSARVETAQEIARVADAHWRLGGNSILVGRPPDEQGRCSWAASRRGCCYRRAASGHRRRARSPAPSRRGRKPVGGPPRRRTAEACRCGSRAPAPRAEQLDRGRDVEQRLDARRGDHRGDPCRSGEIGGNIGRCGKAAMDAAEAPVPMSESPRPRTGGKCSADRGCPDRTLTAQTARSRGPSLRAAGVNCSSSDGASPM